MLSRQDIDTFDRDGVVCLRNAFPVASLKSLFEAYAEHLRDVSKHLYRVWSEAPSGGGREVSYMWMGIPQVRTFCLASPAGAIACDLLRSDAVRFWFDHLLIKKPRDINSKSITGRPTKWHQDLPIWPVSGQNIVSLWIPLTSVDKEAGAMRYIAGSHRWGTRYRVSEGEKIFGDPKFPEMPEENTPFWTNLSELQWDVNPGDCLCHHSLTVHAAGANMKAFDRVAVALRFLGPDVRWSPSAYTLDTPYSNALIPGTTLTEPKFFPLVQHPNREHLTANSG